MIGSSFLSSSTWSSDCAFLNDFPKLDSFELDINLQENSHSSIQSLVKWEEQSSSYSGSPEHSSTSEEYDWTAINGEDISSIFPITDFLASQLLEEEESVIDSLDLDDLDWVSLSSTNQGDIGSASESISEIPSQSQTESPRKKKKRRTKLPEHSSNNSKSWSRMSIKERLKLAHALSEIISRHMGLREQIEVIKLIDPSVVLSPSATEFAINLSHLNDVKVKRICEYLRTHTTCLTDVNSLLSSTKEKYSNAMSYCHRAKRKPKKHGSNNSPYVNEIKIREKKVIRQDKKEKRSGLFVKEKIIKKSSDPQEEVEDVNILE